MASLTRVVPEPVRHIWAQARQAATPWRAAQPHERPAMKTFMLDGLFIALGSAFNDTYIPLFLLGMGATGGQVGMLSSLVGAAAIVGSLLAGPLVLRLGSNKLVALRFSRLGSPLFLSLVLAIPFITGSTTGVVLVMTLQALRTTFAYIGAAPWAAFIPVIVPVAVRARFISVRNMLKLVAALVAVPLAGQIIARFGDYPTGYQASFAISVGCMLASAFFYARLPEPVGGDPGARRQVVADGAAPARWWQGAFGRYVFANFLWGLAAGVAAPFFIVFMSQALGMDAGVIGLLTAITTAAQFVGYATLAPVIDRLGNRWAMRRLPLLLAPVPLVWMVVGQWWHIIPIYLLNGLVGAGFNTANFNMLLEVSPEAGRSTYISRHYTVAAVGSTLGPLAGSWLFTRYGFDGTMLVAGIASLIAALAFVVTLRPPAPLAAAAGGPQDAPA